MFTLRCTNALTKLYGVHVGAAFPPSTSLGDWYANIIRSPGGELVVFVNERTLLTVASPLLEWPDLLRHFVVRVRNALGMLDISEVVIKREIDEMEAVAIARTNNRRILGFMNSISGDLCSYAERGDQRSELSLSDAELWLTGVPRGHPKSFFPAELVRQVVGAPMPCHGMFH